jgi:hypothetical protein
MFDEVMVGLVIFAIFGQAPAGTRRPGARIVATHQLIYATTPPVTWLDVVRSAGWNDQPSSDRRRTDGRCALASGDEKELAHRLLGFEVAVRIDRVFEWIGAVDEDI